jgi:hypothetical protein
MITTKIINKNRNEFTLLDNKGSTAVCCLLFAVCCLLFAVCCLYYYTRKFSFCQEGIAPFETILYQFYFIRQVLFYKFTENSKIIAPNVI